MSLLLRVTDEPVIASVTARPTGSASGHGELTFALAASGTRTHVTHARAHSPLRLLTPRNHGHAAWAYVSAYGGGLVDGDVLHTDVHVHTGAAAFVSTQGPTRVFRSPGGCRTTWAARVDDEALLVCAPDPLSLFANARLLQETEIQLAPTASCVWLDIVTSGRPAHGDRWAFDTFANRFHVTRNGAAVVSERMSLSRSDGALPARMRRFEAFGTLWLLGPEVSDDAARLQTQWSLQPLRKRADLAVAVSPLAEDAWVIRWAATRTERAVRFAHELLSFVPTLLGDDPFARRP